MPRVRKDNDARYANAVAFENFKDETTQDIADALTTKLDNTTDTLTGDLTVTGGVHIQGDDALSFEVDKHWITSNDGAGNFNIRVGHYDNVGGTEESTEDGYVFHEEWSQTGGTWQFNVSDVTTTVGGLNGTEWSWRSQLVIDPSAVSLRYQGTEVLVTKSGGITVTGDVAASTFTGSLVGEASRAKGLNRSDSASDTYNLQFRWQLDKTGYWSLTGYNNDTWHADCWVGWAGNADNASTLGGFAGSTSPTANTVAIRQGNGYLNAVYFNGTGTFSTTGANSGMARFTGTNGTDNYGRCYSATGAAALLQTVGFPALTANIVVPTANRDHGIFGTYDSSKTQHIWSMGTAYKNNASGTNFGNLYGLAYKHTNNTTGGSMGGGHMVVWCQNGTAYCSLGSNIWTSGNVTAYSDIRVKTNIEVIPDALDKIDRLTGYTFDRTDLNYGEDGELLSIPRQTGVIAQEVLEVLPEAVTGSEEEHYSVAYGNMVGLLIEGIKELRAEVEELKRPWWKKLLGVK